MQPDVSVADAVDGMVPTDEDRMIGGYRITRSFSGTTWIVTRGGRYCFETEHYGRAVAFAYGPEIREAIRG